jgi:hypothetical protein
MIQGGQTCSITWGHIDQLLREVRGLGLIPGLDILVTDT